MMILFEISNAQIGESMFYFCCPHCKARFDKDPSKFTMEEKKNNQIGLF